MAESDPSEFDSPDSDSDSSSSGASMISLTHSGIVSSETFNVDKEPAAVSEMALDGSFFTANVEFDREDSAILSNLEG